jgi:hypothetical protein
MDLIPLITAAIALLKTSEAGQKRRNLRMAKKTLKQLQREFKKGGFTEEEKSMLEELQQAIIDKTINL